MGQDYSSAGPDDGQFDKTRWSMVLGAVQSRAPCAQKALAELCGLYWRPLYAFARRRGRSPEDAQDLSPRVFEHLIGSRGLATVERSKGKVSLVFCSHHPHLFNDGPFCWTVGMTGNQEVPGRKQRSREEIKRLVLEFEASGLRQNEFCRNHGLALTRGRTTTTTTAARSTPTTA